MEYQVRMFESDAEIIEIGEGLLKKTLPKKQWTHEAHFAATVYLLLHKPEINLETALPTIIAEYNEATGTPNTATGGYHETLTQFYIRLIRSYTANFSKNVSLKEICNRLIASHQALRSYPLEFWSKDTLFSEEARRKWLKPNLKNINFKRTL